MQIENVQITNFKGIESLGVELGGRSVYVTGANGAGKSSFIDAIFCALTGKNMPPNPITGNKRTGKISVELDGLAIEVEFKKKTGGKIEKKLAVYNTEDGEKLDSPRARIDEVIGVLDFDPFEFMRLSPKPQLDYFCKAFGIKGVKALDDDYKELNEVINFDKKELNAIKAQLEPYKTELVDKELKSASELAQELKAANDHNAQIKSFEGKVATLKERREELKKMLADVEYKITKGDVWLKQQTKKETLYLSTQLDDIDTINDEIRHAKAQKELHDKADTLEAGIEQAKTDKVEKLDAKKALIVEHTKTIEGFDYDDEIGFTLDGLPFHVDQNNTAAQIVAGLKLGAGLLGDVKIARFEGSLLDQENLDAVNEFAEAQGLQLFVELVDRNEKELRLEFIEDETQKSTK